MSAFVAAAAIGDNTAVSAGLHSASPAELAEALYSAAANDHADIIQLLLDAGTDVGVPNEKGVTALHVAAATASEDAVRTLLAAGANISLDNDGISPLAMAVCAGYDATSILVQALPPHLLVKTVFETISVQQQRLGNICIMSPFV